MRIADLIDFIVGKRPILRPADAALRPGDKFGRYEEAAGWTYVEVSALNDGQVPVGCVYARAFSQRDPHGREGYCHLSQLGLRIDDPAWAALRADGWPAPGVVLGFGTGDPPRSALSTPDLEPPPPAASTG
jgi:hypothetical protein